MTVLGHQEPCDGLKYLMADVLYYIMQLTSRNCVPKRAMVSLFSVLRTTPHPQSFCSLFIVGTIYRVIWQSWQTYAYQIMCWDVVYVYSFLFRFCVLGIKSHVKRSVRLVFTYVWTTFTWSTSAFWIEMISVLRCSIVWHAVKCKGILLLSGGPLFKKISSPILACVGNTPMDWFRRKSA